MFSKWPPACSAKDRYPDNDLILIKDNFFSFLSKLKRIFQDVIFKKKCSCFFFSVSHMTQNLGFTCQGAWTFGPCESSNALLDAILFKTHLSYPADAYDRTSPATTVPADGLGGISSSVFTWRCEHMRTLCDPPATTWRLWRQKTYHLIVGTRTDLSSEDIVGDRLFCHLKIFGQRFIIFTSDRAFVCVEFGITTKGGSVLLDWR